MIDRTFCAPPRKRSPGDPRLIAFRGEVVTLLPHGARRVRLGNGHVVTALPSLSSGPTVSLLGDRVAVELPFDELTGWRLSRPAVSAFPENRPCP